jgi:DNA-binding transcriptional LysR family regulator
MIDYHDLDGQLLRLLVAVHEEGSVTRAAARLGVTQSAVSHLLDKLRAIVGDPLFVKSGRGIAPTAHADLLVERARRLLDELHAFSTAGAFDPARLDTTLTIAANDLQRDVLLPALLRRLRAEAPGLTLRVVPSGAPQATMLRDETCMLVLTPRPPEATDILQRRLFEDGYRVFHDPQYRPAPQTEADYLASEHVTVMHDAPRRTLDVDDWLLAQGIRRRVVARVPAFAGVAGFVRGGPWLVTAPGRLRDGVLRGLGDAPVPVSVPMPPLAMYMVWHLRHQQDPLHRWLRQTLVAVASDGSPQADQFQG